MIYMCECGHALWDHMYAGSTYHAAGSCNNKTERKVVHPTDKNVKPITIKGCQCSRFKLGLTLKEYMNKAHAA